MFIIDTINCNKSKLEPSETILFKGVKPITKPNHSCLSKHSYLCLREERTIFV